MALSALTLACYTPRWLYIQGGTGVAELVTCRTTRTPPGASHASPELAQLAKIPSSGLLHSGGGTVLTVQQGRCSDCGRTVYEQGRARIIEAACTRAGSQLVEEFLGQLQKSCKRKDVQRLADVATLLEEYARLGTLKIPRELNQLRGDLWEIKPGDVRLTFYEFTDVIHPVRVARLATGFLKTQLRTQRHQVDKALWVVREDSENESI